jgi:hypothetical protein
VNCAAYKLVWSVISCHTVSESISKHAFHYQSSVAHHSPQQMQILVLQYQFNKDMWNWLHNFFVTFKFWLVAQLHIHCHFYHHYQTIFSAIFMNLHISMFKENTCNIRIIQAVMLSHYIYADHECSNLSFPG